jgi:CRP/FNR family transcriptional regulator, cyclic AMP receptor protein
MKCDPSQTTSTISLAAVLSEIVALIPAGDHQLAHEILTVPLLRTDGELGEVLATTPSAFDFIIVEGFVLKQTEYAGRNSLELLGPGDALAPPLTPSRQLESRATSTYRTHGEALLAVIEEHFRAGARRWPQLSDVLHDRLARQAHRASMHLAILHMGRAEDRLVALFSALADRFGRVASDGIVIDIDLTHDVLGQLIGSRRPTVSLALDRLSAENVLTRLGDGRWRLNTPGVLQ